MRNLCNKEPNKHCLDKDDQINKSHLARPERAEREFTVYKRLILCYRWTWIYTW